MIITKLLSTTEETTTKQIFLVLLCPAIGVQSDIKAEKWLIQKSSTDKSIVFFHLEILTFFTFWMSNDDKNPKNYFDSIYIYM